MVSKFPQNYDELCCKHGDIESLAFPAWGGVDAVNINYSDKMLCNIIYICILYTERVGK